MIRLPWAMLVVVVGKRCCMPQRGPPPMITSSSSSAKVMVHFESPQEERGRIAARLVKANPKSAPLRPTPSMYDSTFSVSCGTSSPSALGAKVKVGESVRRICCWGREDKTRWHCDPRQGLFPKFVDSPKKTRPNDQSPWTRPLRRQGETRRKAQKVGVLHAQCFREPDIQSQSRKKTGVRGAVASTSTLVMETLMERSTTSHHQIIDQEQATAQSNRLQDNLPLPS